MDELSSRVKLFFEVKIEQKLKIDTLALFPQTFILVEQIRKTIHISEHLPLTDVIQRLRSFFSQHEQDLHEISLGFFQKGILSLHSFKLAVWKKTLQASYCLQKFIVLPSRCSVGHMWLITAEMRGPIGSQIFPLHICSLCQTMCYMLHDFPQGCLCLTDAAYAISDLDEGPSTSPHTPIWTHPQ